MEKKKSNVGRKRKGDKKKQILTLVIDPNFIKKCGDTPKEVMRGADLSNTKKALNTFMREQINEIP